MEFDRTQARLLPLADVVMVVMLSRPPSRALRNTRVTSVTIGLAALLAILCSGLLGITATRPVKGGGWGWWVGSPALSALAPGCADLALFGIRQRWLARH